MLSYIEARKLLTVGVLACSLTLFWFGILNLDAGYWDFFWPQILQGISLSLLFVPMTTMTMDAIPREEMGNATSIYNLMRNIGGSIGIATSATMLERSRQTFTNTLGTHVTPFALKSQQMLEQLRSAIMGSGADPVTASQRAQAVLFGMVQRQASMLAFVNLMRLFGGLFVLIVPLLWFAKAPRTVKHRTASAVH
jgi:DHA2 family multidrug resistance protein